MKVSELIKELQERLELYGDWPVVFRDDLGEYDGDVVTVYADTDGEEETGEGKIVLSELVFF